jgi:hypothetical protein
MDGRPEVRRTGSRIEVFTAPSSHTWCTGRDDPTGPEAPKDEPPMFRTDFRRSFLPALGAGLMAVSLIACSSAVGSEPTPPPASEAPATPVPATPVPATPVPATPVPATPVPATPEPSDPGEDAMPINVVLDTADGSDVDVDIIDYPGVIEGGQSGSPAEGVSIDVDDIDVQAVDARTIQLTWSDFAMDNDLTLYVYRTDTGFRLVLIRPEPTEAVDAIGADRQLLLTFEQDIDPADLVVEIQDGIDTPND